MSSISNIARMLRPSHYIFIGVALVGAFLIYKITSHDDVSQLAETIDELGSAAKHPKYIMPDASKSSKTFSDFKGVPQTDEKFIQFLRSSVIRRPAKGPYRLNKPQLRDFSQFGQSLLANDLVFKGKRNGFFVEVGALNGEYCSNSLFYERELGWTGLLIEPNYDTYSQLVRKRRKAYSVHGALSPERAPKELLIKNAGFAGEESKVSNNKDGMLIKAYPLFSLLLAVNVTTIDFFSLDVEGQELQVLKTLPFDKMKFMVMCVEKTQTPLGEVIKLLTPLGYKFIGILDNDGWFVHPNVYKDGMKVFNS